MLLLTWHGTILRVEQSQNRLLHAPLVPVRGVARDFAFTPPQDDAGPVLLPGGMHLHAGPAEGAGYITYGERVLRVSREEAWASFNDGTPAEQDGILAISETEAAALRALLSAAHILPGTEEAITPTLEAGFMLAAGPHRFDLRVARPDLVDEIIVLPAAAGRVPRAPPPEVSEIPLRAAPPPEAVSSVEAFRSAQMASLTIEGEPEHHFLPLTGAFSTQDWFYKASSTPPRVGTFKSRHVVRRACDVFVLESSGIRTVLKQEGALRGAPPKTARPPYAPGISREGDHFFLAAAVLDDAPTLIGAHALLPAGAASPLLETILPLVMMAPFLDEGTRLLLPAGDDANWPSWLAFFGFGHFEIISAPGAICRVENLVWPDAFEPDHLSAAVANQTRSRAYARFEAATPRRRLFLTVGLVNPDRLANVASAFGYERLDTLPDDITARALLFAEADSVMAAHGPVLENILFSRAGTQVVELSPDNAWRSVYGVLSDSLGHSHAVLPCEISPEGGSLAPEPQALRRLLRVMAARR